MLRSVFLSVSDSPLSVFHKAIVSLASGEVSDSWGARTMSRSVSFSASGSPLSISHKTEARCQ